MAEENASDLFSDLKQQVYQIRVIDIASDDKSTIGSGFLISEEGMIATNFHVVSSYVHEPDKYRLEYVDHLGGTGLIELQDIDVVHDLAIGKIEGAGYSYFALKLGDLAQGDRLYSMGNPLDLGMTIIQGIYNGLVKKSRYKKILFSGSLNSGMSGGPALDAKGQVVGINVSKGSEQLSFLVPVEHLSALVERATDSGPVENFKEAITGALLRDQQQFYGDLLEKKWINEPFMETALPIELSGTLECWGHTEDKEDYLYRGVHQHCRSSDAIYLSQTLSTGHFSYSYEWNESQKLNRVQFYHLMEGRFDHRGLNNVIDHEDATNFACHTDFVVLSQHEWKVSSCLRAYKKYRGLYDTSIVIASVDTNDKGLIVRVAAAGLSKSNVQGLVRRFLETIEWKR